MQVEYRPVKTLVPYARNSRTHSEEQVVQIAASIREFGWTNPVLVDGDNGIIAGHGRVMAARVLGVASVPVIELAHMTEAQKRAYIIADNKLAMNAGWDNDMLTIELGELGEIGFDLSLTGFDQIEIDGLMADIDVIHDGLTDEDAVPDVPVEPVTKPGDVWLLGKHRLMCGDSASTTAVEQLMDGKLADMVMTDPPYGVAYVGKTKDALVVENDDVSPEKLQELCAAWFGCVDVALRGGGYLLATVPARPLHLIFAQDWHSRGWLRQILVWNKDSMVFGHSEYHYKHEPILFGWKPGGDRMKNPDRTRVTVWDFPRPKSSRIHPTMKPVEMWEFGIVNHSGPGGLLFEPFSGSGTTIIAAEKTGRKCYAMELSPQYADVAVRRWEEFTGKQATLESTGQTFKELSCQD